MTVEIEMSDEDFKAVSEYAAKQNFSLSEFFLKSAREYIEDAKFQAVSHQLMERNKKVYEALAK